MIRKNVIIFYDYFLPAYKAGGPVQSIANLVRKFGGTIDFFIVCSAHDHNEISQLENIVTDKWCSFENDTAQVFYISKINLTKKTFIKIYCEVRPDIAIINGLFSWWFNIIPLYVKSNCKKIIAPRGMLQKGALASKTIKKAVYIKLLKYSGLLKNVKWHATDSQEEQDIGRVMGFASNISIMPNIPKKPLESISYINKGVTLKFCYLSLIAEKKNLLLLLKALHFFKSDLILDIYGPVKDPDYWLLCQAEIRSLTLANLQISYKGDVKPDEVQRTICNYHAMVLPSKGENFGHAIYEAFSVGRPVIISKTTPWQNLKEKKAGWDIDVNTENIITALKELESLNQENFDLYCNNAHKIAFDYYYKTDFKALFYNLLNS